MRFGSEVLTDNTPLPITDWRKVESFVLVCKQQQPVYFTSLITGVLGLGPAATISASVPDLHYFADAAAKM